MAELLANSPVAGKREPIGELAAELAKGATGAKALKLKATIAKDTGLRAAGQSRVLIGPAGGQCEIVRFTTVAGEPTEYEILERAAEESIEAAWPAGTKVWGTPTIGALAATFAKAIAAVPAGGTQFQVLKKTASVDYAMTWSRLAPVFPVALNVPGLIVPQTVPGHFVSLRTGEGAALYSVGALLQEGGNCTIQLRRNGEALGAAKGVTTEGGQKLQAQTLANGDYLDYVITATEETEGLKPHGLVVTLNLAHELI